MRLNWKQAFKGVITIKAKMTTRYFVFTCSTFDGWVAVRVLCSTGVIIRRKECTKGNLKAFTKLLILYCNSRKDDRRIHVIANE